MSEPVPGLGTDAQAHGETGPPTVGGGASGGHRALNARMVLPLLALIAIAGGFALLLQGTSHISQPIAGKAHAERSQSFTGLTLSPPKPAPPLALRNYLGQPVNINQFRGKAVLVTFLYTHCETACPLITSDLHTALEAMGPREAEKVQIIAVSVDPRGDTPKTVAAFLKVHQMTGRMLYLLGSAHQLAATWRAWGVGSESDTSEPDFINHSAIVYGISGHGKAMTIYSASMKPSEVVHDVPLLAAD
jgi:protein SCO1